MIVNPVILKKGVAGIPENAILFYNNKGWKEVYIFSWDGGIPGGQMYPGIQMTYTGVSNLYYFPIEPGRDLSSCSFNFNNGSGESVMDMRGIQTNCVYIPVGPSSPYSYEVVEPFWK